MLKAVALNLFRALTGAYGISVAGFLLLRATVGESFGLVLLYNSFVHLAVLPAVTLLPFALILRRWGIAALLLPAVLTAAVWYGPGLFPPDIPTVPRETPRLTVVTFNIHRWSSTDGEAMLATIRNIDADVVLLQELHVEGAARIETDLADLYPHMVLRPDPDNSIIGGGVLSRYPVVSEEAWIVTAHRHQRIEIDFDGTQVVIYSAHAAYPFGIGGFDLRARDVADLLERAMAESLPVILAGDFNLTEHSESYGDITAAFTDAYPAAGRGPGWSYVPVGRLPFGWRWRLARIDYVFYGAGWVALDARVWGDSGGSDHHPVLVTLALID